MRTSESIAKISQSIIAFQREVKDPRRDESNPFFKSKYVTLDNLISTVRPVLSKHGLSFFQVPAGNGETASITTILLHESGEYIESDPLHLKAEKNTPQAMGSAITYGRRYSLSAMLGVSWDDDDDGNEASGQTPAKANTKQNAPNQTAKSKQQTEKQKKNDLYRKLKEQMELLGVSADEVRWMSKEKFGVEDCKDLTLEQLDALVLAVSKQ